MVKANKPSPDTRPPALINMEVAGVGIETITVDGIPFQYTLIKAGAAFPLPYGLGFWADHLFISEETPMQFRPFLLAHEVRHEKFLTDLPEQERCLRALKMEIVDVFREIPTQGPEYIRQRKVFYDALFAYYKDPRNLVIRGEAFAEGIRRAKIYLDEKTHQFPVRARDPLEFGLDEL